MNYFNLVQCLLIKVPELKEAYNEEMEWLDNELQHVIFGLVLNPHLIKLLSLNPTSHEEQLKRIFSFLEEMANSEDENVKEVLLATVLEALVVEREIINITKSYMHEKTLAYFEYIEKSFGWTK